MIRRPASTAALIAGLFGAATPVAAGQPDAVSDAVVVQKDASASNLAVLTNDTVDPTARITATTTPAHGTVTIAADGLSVSYSPTAGYSGADTFDYTVTDTVNLTDTATVTIKVNAPPVAVDDPRLDAGCFYGPSQTFALPEDKVTPFVAGGACNLLADDTDADGTVVDWEIVASPAHGTVTNEIPLVLPGLSSDFTYTPDADYYTTQGDWVSDSFTYRAIDNDGGRSAPATVRIWIAPVNDAPSFTAGATTITVGKDAAFSEAWATDIDPGPNESSQTVTFVIEDSPTNPSDLFSAGPAISTSGELSFTATAGASGSATFNVTAHDDGGLEYYGSSSEQPPADDTSDPVALTITIENGVPDAIDDTPPAIAEDAGPTSIDVLRNDSDPDQDLLSILAFTQGAKGVVAISGGGAGLTYDPSPDATGSDSFTYTITDSTGATDTATVTVTITAANDAPLAGDDDLTVTEDEPTPAAVDVLANDSDVDRDTLLVTGNTNGAKGVVTITGDGTGIAYKPNTNSYGSDSFTYTVSDGNGGSTTATVHVTITPLNDKPNAVNDGVPTAYTVYLKAGPTAIPVLVNDTSLPDATERLTIVAVSQGAHGTVAITGGGTGLTYAATGTTTGIDVFTYTISDGNGGTNTASVRVTAAADTSRPVSTAPVITTSHRGRTTIRLTLTWTLTDTGSGIASQLLQRRMDGGTWLNVALASSSVRTATFTVTRGHAYTYRIRATDRSGNVGAFATSRLVQT